MATLSTKHERINLRLNTAAKQMLEKAANLEGKTVSSFILATALAQAEKTVQAHEHMRLRGEHAEAFFNALAAPISFNEKLSRALAEHDKRVIGK